MDRSIRQVLVSSLAVGAFLAGLVGARLHSYLLFHSLAELFSVMIGAGIFLLAWNSRRFHNDAFLIFLGAAFGCVAAIDVLHTLSYKGMGVIGDTEDVNRPTQLWVAARYIEALAMLAAPFLVGRQARPHLTLAAFALVFAVVVLEIFQWHIVPACYIPGTGLTPIKIASEYIICALIAAAIAALWWRRRAAALDPRVIRFLTAAMVVTIVQEFCFTMYSDPYGAWSTAGHCLKILAFFLFYKAILETGLARPYQLLFRDLVQRGEQLKRATAEAEAANRAKDHFLAVLSHELRTPLTPALVLASAMEADADLSAAARADLATIRRNIELETRLIDDLLDLTRITRGKLLLQLATADVHAKIAAVAEMCRSDVQQKQMRLSIQTTAAQHHVRGDSARLQQIIWNLLRNAIKFTPAGGSIGITTHNTTSPADASLLVIEVADTGVGIGADALPRIFDAFEQTGDDTQRRGGLGLGLSITRGLVELHGGQIAARSEGPGRGTTFTIHLPVVTPAPAPVTPQVALPSRPAGAGRPQPIRILLVEDHVDTSRALSQLLRRSGYDVRTAGDIAAALEALQSGPADILVSDLDLPDGSGHSLMQTALSRHSVVGIALSGFGQPHDIQRSRDAGFAEHLVKPINVQLLKDTIIRLADRAE